MQMHHHASLPEAMQPALFQHSNQSWIAHSPWCTSAAHGSQGNVAENQARKTEMWSQHPLTVCFLAVATELA